MSHTFLGFIDTWHEKGIDCCYFGVAFRRGLVAQWYDILVAHISIRKSVIEPSAMVFQDKHFGLGLAKS